MHANLWINEILESEESECASPSVGESDLLGSIALDRSLPNSPRSVQSAVAVSEPHLLVNRHLRALDQRGRQRCPLSQVNQRLFGERRRIYNLNRHTFRLVPEIPLQDSK